MSVNDPAFPLPEEYDMQVRRTIPHYDMIHEEVIDLVQALPSPVKVWLDTGCGTGVLVRRALGRMPHARYILSDPSPGMLDLARQRLKGEGAVSVLRPLRTQDLRGQVDEVPDVITALMCHHYLSRDDRVVAVKVCHDLLPSGGAFITFENIRPLTGVGTALGMRRWSAFQLSQGRSAEEVKAHLARFDREYFPITVEEHLRLLRSVGFGTVELLWCSGMQAGFYCIK